MRCCSGATVSSVTRLGRTRWRCAALVVLVGSAAGCGSSQRHETGLPLPSVAKKGISISFPGGTCGPAKVGQPFSTFIVLQGGVPPYEVTWYVDRRSGGLDNVQVEKLGSNLDPIYANGTKYTITFTPKTTSRRVTLRAVDARAFGQPDEMTSTVIGAGGPCQITP